MDPRLRRLEQVFYGCHGETLLAMPEADRAFWGVDVQWVDGVLRCSTSRLSRSALVNSAMGLGVTGPAAPAALDRVVEYFEARHVPTGVMVSDGAPREWLEPLLVARGFSVAEQDSFVAADPFQVPEAPQAPRVTVEAVTAGSVAAGEWLDVLSRSFGQGSAGLTRFFAALGEGFLRVPDGVHLLARLDGRPVGTGSLLFRDGVAFSFNSGTIPEARGKGLQAQLIAHRARAARDAGAGIIATQVAPGEGSDRNWRRFGFTHVATLPIYVAARPAGGPR